MRAAPGMNTASPVRDAPSICPTSASWPREETSSAVTAAASSDVIIERDLCKYFFLLRLFP